MDCPAHDVRSDREVPSKKNMTSLAICGVGNIGKVHIKSLLSLRGCELSGIYDTNAQVCAQVSRHFNLHSYGSLDQLLEDRRLNAVVIATPSSSHLELCRRVLAAGKHAFLEKPLANTLEDSAAIVKLSEQSGKIVQVGFCERFNPCYLEAKRVAAEGRLGDIRAIQSSRVAPYHLSDPTWALGVLDTAVHNLDLILWLMGHPPLSVITRAARIYPDSRIPDCATILLMFAGGALATDQITWLEARAHPLNQCARSRIFIAGDKGAFELDLSDRPTCVLTPERFSKIDSVVIGGPDYYGGLKLQFEYFLRSIELGEPVRATVRDAFETERLAIAAYESLRTGREVTLSPCQ